MNKTVESGKLGARSAFRPLSIDLPRLAVNGSRLLPLMLVVFLAGCGNSPPSLSPEAMRAPERVELLDIPFFHDLSQACAPAALAGVLGERGVVTSPGLLEEGGLGKKGDLPREMLDMARARGLTVTQLEPSISALIESVSDSHPVLLAQQDGIGWLQDCRYAVLVGYDRRKGRLILQSGAQRRMQMSFKDFEPQWARAGHWAVTLR